MTLRVRYVINAVLPYHALYNVAEGAAESHPNAVIHLTYDNIKQNSMVY